MKKVIIADSIRTLLDQDAGFLERTNVELFEAGSNDEALEIHRREKADLIITLLNMPGMSGDKLCSLVRAESALRAVSIVIYCPDTEKDAERCEKSRANAVLSLPVHTASLADKARQLLDISARGPYRVNFPVRVEGQLLGKPFYCSSENISATGMLIMSDRDLDEGDKMECSFVLPDRTPVETMGEVVRSIKKGARADFKWYGIRFLSLTPEAQRALETFVEKKSRIPTASPRNPFNKAV